MNRYSAYTLTELLIALLILGIIAAFTIPKVLHNQYENQKASVFKETYSALHEVLSLGLMTRELTPANTNNYFASHLNAIRVCGTNASTEGCWDSVIQGAMGGEELEPGFLLPNGAVVVGIHNGNWPCEVFSIDWNGTKGPNIIGEDKVSLLIRYDADSPLQGWCLSTERAGTIRDLWGKIF